MNHQQKSVIAGQLNTGVDHYASGILAVADGVIAYAGESSGFPLEGWPDPVVVDPRQILVPGFVDVHCHGGFGTDFSSSSESSIRHGLHQLHLHGATTLAASLVTAAREDLLQGLTLFASLTEENLVAGSHLEGPFLSHCRRGAQNPEWLREPDPELTLELLNAAQGTLRVMTYAPELPGSTQLLELLTEHGVLPSLGHTDADAVTAAKSLAHVRGLLASHPQENRRAVPTITHLFNGMPPIHHRAPGAALACLRDAAKGQAIVELIADGNHVDAFMITTTFELAGAENIALITDSMAAAGLDDGIHRLGSSEVRVSDGQATLTSTGAIAGGTATMADVLRTTLAAGVPFADAVRSATVVPAGILGLSHRVGSLCAGMDADVVVLNDQHTVSAVMRKGSWIKDLEAEVAE
ncbi:amidohydrolase family protein [Arthrobacter roseus]|uniref:amidohydrolase family protein n=1 Tax=Arthrobacter roseus TaxID=136274 RepID=UPI001962F59C|nr:N-acetylglucosamine-6-phosphate deacetylase [Arthrobacter roseus]